MPSGVIPCDSVRNRKCALLQPDEEFRIHLIYEAMFEQKLDGIERASKTELIGEVNGIIEGIRSIVRTRLSREEGPGSVREGVVGELREIC